MPTAKTNAPSKPSKMFPLGKKVVVVPAPRKEVSDGGVLLPEDAQRLPKHGKVFAIGPEVTKVQVGQKVLFAQYAGHELELDDGKNPPLTIIVMDESNLDAVIE